MKKRFLSLALTVLMLISLFPFTASAAEIVDSGSCGETVTWTLDSDGLLTISGTGEMESFNWGDYMSYENKTIQSIVIEDGVTSLGAFAFYGCSTAQHLTIPASVTSIGVEAVHGLSLLMDITFTGTREQWYAIQVSDGNSRLYDLGVDCSDGWVAPGSQPSPEPTPKPTPTPPTDPSIIAYGYGGELDDMFWTLDRDGVLTISGSGWIYYCSWLENELVKQQAKTAVFTEGLTGIAVGGGMFSECTALTRVVIPASMTRQLLGGDFIMACAVETIEVSPDNPTMASVDGVLYTKDLTTLLKCPAARSGAFTVPDGTGTIGIGAFLNCDALTTVTIPASVTEIEEDPFDADALTEILVAPDSASFASVDGVLFTKDGTELIAFPHANCSRYTVPDGVTSIRNSAFRCADGLESVVIPEGVTRIGLGVFGECQALTTVTIPTSLTLIDYSAFSYDWALTDVWYGGTKAQWKAIEIREGNEQLTNAVIHCTDGVVDPDAPEPASGQCGENVFWDLDENGVLTIRGTGDMTNYDWMQNSPFYNNKGIRSVVIEPGVTSIGDLVFLFDGISNIRQITIPETVTRIGINAFSGCNQLESVTIPERVTSIGWCAFGRCSALTSITIPAAVESIGEAPFVDCHSMTEILVSPENAYFESRDGVLFDKGCTAVLEYPCNKQGDYTVPDGVVRIASRAFEDLAGLTALVLPEGVETIEDGAFCGCWNMTSITLPSSLRSIGSRAFVYDNSLADVYYLGSQARWETVQIGSNNDSLMNAAIHCLGVDPFEPIVVQPEDAAVLLGETARFTVVTQGEGLTFRWQYRQPGKTTWYDSTASGAATNTLEIQATAKRDGQSYRCVITDDLGRRAESDAATLIVAKPQTPLAITAQPQDQTAVLGANATFTVAAQGEGLTYQWQYCPAGKNAWYDSTASGADTDTLTIQATAKRDGQRYRCVVSDRFGSRATTEAAVLTIGAPQSEIRITAQPADQTVALKADATFTVQAEGEGLTYRWQYCQAGKNSWYDSTAAGADTDALTIQATAKRDGQRYRCVITDAYGSQLISDPATLHIG